MTTVIALILAGVLLLAAEVFLPGAVLGVAGAAFMTGGVAVAFVQFGATAGTVTTLVALALLATAVIIEFKVLPRSRLARAFSMTTTTGGTAGKTPPVEQIGRACVAVTKLRPSGYVRIGAEQFEAFCRGGAAEPGDHLQVIGVDNFRLIVNQIESKS